MRAMVGKEAPDFGALAFHEGGFKSIKLSDYRGNASGTGAITIVMAW